MANKPTIVNKYGKMLGWNNVNFNLLGRDAEGISEISYDDNTEFEGVKGAGPFNIGYGEGNYTAKASVTFYIEEWVAIQRSLPPGMRVSDIAPFPVVVEYEYQNMKLKDVITYCKLTGRGVSVKQGDKTIAYKADLFVIGEIQWNV